MSATTWTSSVCRNCGRPASDGYCGVEDCMRDIAQSIVRRRAWAGRFLALAILSAAASFALIVFFQRQDWQDAVIRWAYEHEQYQLAVVLYTGTWQGLTWEAWSTIGLMTSMAAFTVFMLLSSSAGRMTRSVPGMKLLVKQEQSSSSGVLTVLGALLVIPLVIAFLAIIIGAAAAGGGNGAHHHDD